MAHAPAADLILAAAAPQPGELEPGQPPEIVDGIAAEWAQHLTLGGLRLPVTNHLYTARQPG